MTKLNNATRKMADEVDLVRCEFAQGSKLYTYKAPKGLLVKHCLAAIQDAKQDFKFVRVVEVIPQDEVDKALDVPYDLAWVLCRVTDDAKECKKIEQDLV